MYIRLKSSATHESYPHREKVKGTTDKVVFEITDFDKKINRTFTL